MARSICPTAVSLPTLWTRLSASLFLHSSVYTKQTCFSSFVRSAVWWIACAFRIDKDQGQKTTLSKQKNDTTHYLRVSCCGDVGISKRRTDVWISGREGVTDEVVDDADVLFASFLCIEHGVANVGNKKLENTGIRLRSVKASGYGIEHKAIEVVYMLVFGGG